MARTARCKSTEAFAEEEVRWIEQKTRRHKILSGMTEIHTFWGGRVQNYRRNAGVVYHSGDRISFQFQTDFSTTQFSPKTNLPLKSHSLSQKDV
jgi:hypothetical protein